MISFLNVIVGSLKTFQGFHLLSDFIVMVLIVTTLPHWVSQFLKEAGNFKSFKLKRNFKKRKNPNEKRPYF